MVCLASHIVAFGYSVSLDTVLRTLTGGYLVDALLSVPLVAAAAGLGALLGARRPTAIQGTQEAIGVLTLLVLGAGLLRAFGIELTSATSYFFGIRALIGIAFSLLGVAALAMLKKSPVLATRLLVVHGLAISLVPWLLIRSGLHPSHLAD